MTAHPRRLHSLRTGRTWLVWLALLLPLAQWAGAAHALTHVVSQSTDPQDGGAPAHLAACDICLSTTALGHGGAAPSASMPALVVLEQPAPHASAAGVWAGPPTLAYLSRAPPPTPR